ncbi:MAG: BrnT family toxin [Clostridiaceae bacterium]|nr:BrnT family toxin [Clostridiaceae bacterium]
MKKYIVNELENNYNIIIKFEWDINKNYSNIRKHKISFEEAKTVFLDDYAIVFDDPEHSIEEERFLIIGLSLIKNILIVSHCYKEEEEIIRIISARKATKKEMEFYYNRR